MAWSTPYTATANTSFAASDFNAKVRDDLLETFPGKGTSAGKFFVTTGSNAVAARAVTTNSIMANEALSSGTSYTDLNTVGPSVTVTTGTKALVWISVNMSQTGSSSTMLASYEISGATSRSASDTWSLIWDGIPAGNGVQVGAMHLAESLTAGSNTFKLKYKRSSGIATYYRRIITVIPF